MKNPATFRRTAAGVGLVLAAVLMAIAMGTDVPFSGEPDEVLSSMDDAGGRAWLSGMTYNLAQLALIAGALGIAHMVRTGAPVLSSVGGALAVIGAFGHTVHGGGVLLLISMSGDETNRAAHAAVFEDFMTSPAGVFSVMGLLGTVLGLILLTIGLWRAAVGPRWVPPALAAFVVLEFAGSEITEWATAAAGAIYLAAFVALAITIWRSPASDWASGVDA